MKTIYTEKAPTPAGHYSQAVIHNGLVFVSGQLPTVPSTGEKLSGDIREQTKQVMRNIQTILEAANSDIGHLLKVNIYVSDISLWSEVNEVYTEFMGDHKPARVVIPTRDLHHGVKIEVDVIAAVKEG